MKTVQQATQLRTRKLGLLLYDARISHNRSVDQCAKAMRISPADYEQIESGQAAPSLPQLEAFAFYLDIPLEHFWSAHTLLGQTSPEPVEQSKQYVALRHKIIGARLRMARQILNLSLQELETKTNIQRSVIEQYELGEKPIPLPELEILTDHLQVRMEELLDQRGPIGQWRTEKIAVQQIMELPLEVREFICKPVNLPYLKLAMRLSDLSVEKLRNVAEGLLEITY
ncbi:MAG: helix-turn-helix transcriptional regulator [Bellilinea sp.]|jgi:transcriptional regulator with XRE-family HTH domain